jgi:SAM-dependent methyltransferase
LAGDVKTVFVLHRFIVYSDGGTTLFRGVTDPPTMTTPTQRWDARDYATNARFVADLGQPVLDLLQPQSGERILDLGCGDGALTARLAERGATVVGIDASAELLDAARARGLDARRMDARALTFTNEFDAVFSNAALHWIPGLNPVLEGVHRALRPHGRFVGECGGHGCVAAVLTSLRAVAARRDVEIAWPWRFPTVEEFEAHLVETGFKVVDVRLVPRPTELPSGMAAWLHTFAAWAFERLPETERTAAFAETVELLRPSLCDSRGRWTADYVRLRFAARREETGS